MRTLLSSFVELVHLQSEMNKLFEALRGLQGHHDAPDVDFEPPYDILETPDAVVVQVDLPGVSASSLNVVVRGNLVIVAGERDRMQPPGIVAYHLMERSRGRFERRFHVEGAINTHKGRAVYERGVLSLNFPRVPDRRGNPVTLPLDIKG